MTRKEGLLLVNLGTPEDTSAKSVRRYLNEFLSDPRIIDMPQVLWRPLLYGVISPLRAPASAKKYRTVWHPEGSPLMVHTKNLAAKVQELLPDYDVKIAMRYGQPSIQKQVKQMVTHGVESITVIPLFPQYSSTTTASVMDEVWRALGNHRRVPELRFVRDYPDHPEYLDALAETVRDSFEKNGKPDVLVLSYHGIPERFVSKHGDDYPEQCQATTAGLVERLGLDEDDYIVTYQSKFGPGEWIGPATIDTVEALGKQGVEHIQVIAPGFVADCLETLEELDMLNRETYLAAGGSTFHYIPALNDHSGLARALADLAENEQ